MFQILKTFVVLAGVVAALPTNEHSTDSPTCNVQSASHCCYTNNDQKAGGVIPVIANLGNCYPIQVPIIGAAVQGGDSCKGGQAACCGRQFGLVNAGCAVAVGL